MHDGIPYSLEIPRTIKTRDTLTTTEFDDLMQAGLEQAKQDDSVSVSEVFQNLRSEM